MTLLSTHIISWKPPVEAKKGSSYASYGCKATQLNLANLNLPIPRNEMPCPHLTMRSIPIQAATGACR